MEPKSELTESAHIAYAFNKFPDDNNNNVHVFITLEVIALLSQESRDETYINSGYSYHLSPCCELFLDSTYTILEKPIKVHLGNTLVIQAIGKGSICYLMTTPKEIVPTIIPNVLYVSELAATLLSVTHFMD